MNYITLLQLIGGFCFMQKCLCKYVLIWPLAFVHFVCLFYTVQVNAFLMHLNAIWLHKIILIAKALNVEDFKIKFYYLDAGFMFCLIQFKY